MSLILVPDNVEDEAIGCIHFSERFTSRYGGVHPAFFTGTLEDAIKEACSKPAKDVSQKTRVGLEILKAQESMQYSNKCVQKIEPGIYDHCCQL